MATVARDTVSQLVNSSQTVEPHYTLVIVLARPLHSLTQLRQLTEMLLCSVQRLPDEIEYILLQIINSSSCYVYFIILM